ncbi:MAG: hypothetical protein IKK43_06655 [Clostridia bacterium]|nr:hypothetical protein [Clostridia bacterium]
MIAIHESGLFAYDGVRVILNKLPNGVRGYSIANSEGDIIINQPASSRYKFWPNGNMLVVNLDNGQQRKFQLNSNKAFTEVSPAYIVNEADLEGEDVLLYHLGLLDKKYSK